MKTHIITISKYFPTTHLRAGRPTNFAQLIEDKTKLHTIRANYDRWAKKISEIQEGKAVLSVREWTEKPYRSPMEELFQLTSADGIGIQKIQFNDYLYSFDIDGVQAYVRTLAANDGLSLSDFNSWFKKVELAEPMAIIHFTPFRYPSSDQKIALHSLLHVNKAV